MSRDRKNYEDTAQEILSKLIWIETTLKKNVLVPPTVVYANTVTGGGRDKITEDNGGGGGGNADATLQVIRRVSSPMDVNGAATVERIVENAERLERSLEVLVEEARDDSERRAAASQLAGRLRWFREDLNRSDGQLDELLVEYDGYRKAYYRLRQPSERRVSCCASTNDETFVSTDDETFVPTDDETFVSTDRSHPGPPPPPRGIPGRDETLPRNSPVRDETPPRDSPVKDETPREGNPDQDDYHFTDRSPDAPNGDDGVTEATPDVHAHCRRPDANAHGGLYKCPGLLDVTKCNHGSEELRSECTCGTVDENANDPDDWKSLLRR
ncbi:uncharacterized protein LOC112690034 isoform X2 [Sipha flava]|nr:uncharacterized protein LOC112690034 isoform X2 [Sipha flava]